SAVVAEVRHADHTAPYVHISSAPAPFSMKAEIFTRYRALASDTIGIASAAPEFQREAVQVAGPSVRSLGVVR
ncbi:MAG: hypothetical protein JWL86_4864, partial [Rhizobium sp.]|nr:hypothetical protein [Rhizobium sp.]